MAVAPPQPAAICSLGPVPLGRSSEINYLLAEARPDTVYAGMGPVEVSEGPGHWSRAEPREVFGQVLRVDRFGGPDSVTIAEAFADLESPYVVAVPWDYDPACRTAIWGRSAQWIEAGLRGLYTLRLRPKEHWVGGMPTLDAFAADLQPYPYALFFEHGYRGADAAHDEDALSAGEYFDLYRRLPAIGTPQEERNAAVVELLDWIAEVGWEHRYPASEMVRLLCQRSGS